MVTCFEDSLNSFLLFVSRKHPDFRMFSIFSFENNKQQQKKSKGNEGFPIFHDNDSPLFLVNILAKFTLDASHRAHSAFSTVNIAVQNPMTLHT